MPKYIAAVVILGALAGCATIGTQSLSDEEYAKILVGTWTNKVSSEEKYNYFEKEVPS